MLILPPATGMACVLWSGVEELSSTMHNSMTICIATLPSCVLIAAILMKHLSLNVIEVLPVHVIIISPA